MNFFNRNKQRGQKLPKEIMTEEFRVRVCTHTAEKLRVIENSDDGLPIYRLIMIAIDNEFEKLEPFKIPLKYKDEPYVEDKYSHEANLIFNFIKTYSKDGCSLMMLTLLRRKVGISDRERVYRGYIELLNAGLISEHYPKFGFVYPKWYRKAKIARRTREG